MTLPAKGSRDIEVGGERFRWRVRASDGQLSLTVEHASGMGQVLRAYFDPHDLYRRDGTRWTRVRQRRALGPAVVARTIRHARANGWEPTTRGLPPLAVYRWDTEHLADLVPTPWPGEGVALRARVSEELDLLCFELSTHPGWRARLIRGPVGQRVAVPLSEWAPTSELGLTFVAWNDGWTRDGWVVFGFACDQLPWLETYSTNDPRVWVERPND